MEGSSDEEEANSRVGGLGPAADEGPPSTNAATGETGDCPKALEAGSPEDVLCIKAVLSLRPERDVELVDGPS